MSSPPVSIITDKELPDDARALWLKALSAVELRNFGYAISLISAVLKKAPGFLDGRKILRRAEVAATKGKKSFLSGLSTTTFKGGSIVKKDPIAAMEVAEKALESDPYNSAANKLLMDAAKAADLLPIAAFALETLIQGSPKDTKVMHELGQLYVKMGDPEKAVKLYTVISEIDPADLIAVKMSKDAAASETMKKGGWEQATSYRDIMKDKEQAVSLEQQSRVFKDVGMIDSQIAELGAQYEAQPEGVDVVRRIANLYDQKQQIVNSPEDLAEAIKWYDYANELTKGADPAVARKCSDLRLKFTDQRIKTLQEWLANGNEEHPEAQELRDELDGLLKQRAASQIGDAKRRVERNPTDLQLRYELGERLMQAGQYTEAIPELQRGKNNPNVRLRALNLLGQCFTEKGMLDLAVSQFKTVISEIGAMDSTKKEVLYKLGLVYEKMDNKKDYLECMKQIYEVDYGYLDVAKRVESSYGGEGA
jgi:tetratricopeptide (TPR) repeat protein